MTKDFSERILLSMTGRTSREVVSKILSINKKQINTAALFFESVKESDRDSIYLALEKSNIKKIPLIHIRGDVSKDEIKFFKDKYKTKYFTIHEDEAVKMKKWTGYHKDLYLEMNTDNFVSKKIDIDKLGGFCIDLSHFKVEEQKWSKEFLYILSKRKKSVFACNHINGYSYKKNCDLHVVKDLMSFNYLNTLPEFLFGKMIAIETYNSIDSQIKFKNYLIKLLDKKFN